MNSGFTGCAVTNSVPVTFCNECINTYIDQSNAYKEFLNGRNDDGKTCKNEFFEQDRLGLVQNIFLNTEKLWNTGSCSSKLY